MIIYCIYNLYIITIYIYIYIYIYVLNIHCIFICYGFTRGLLCYSLVCMNDLYDQLNLYNAGQRRTPHKIIYISFLRSVSIPYPNVILNSI